MRIVLFFKAFTNIERGRRLVYEAQAIYSHHVLCKAKKKKQQKKSWLEFYLQLYEGYSKSKGQDKKGLLNSNNIFPVNKMGQLRHF